ncbi:MAG: FAD-dependent oxidoreductase [Deltaproteobacteria bacterium]|nr:FAD-dependent oxidoreductase [Deltaproteobacteria bacterium]
MEIEVLVIGGGAVGLSCAYELARRGRQVMLLERHERLGEEASTHNSGVIHAGIPYEPGSNKAVLCVHGRELLYRRLYAWDVPHRRCGKIIVASAPDEITRLEALFDNARRNGVDDLSLIDGAAIRAREPHVVGTAAMLSPSTGVFDAGAFVRALETQALAAGVTIVPRAAVTAIERHDEAVGVSTDMLGSISARAVVNAAGLFADEIAAMSGESGHHIYPCRGEYAAVIPSKADLVNTLVYPLPGKIGLGVHFTRTVHGELWLGPDAHYIESKTDYESNRRPVEEFAEAARRLCPAITADDLRLGPSGIRASATARTNRSRISTLTRSATTRASFI